MNVGTFTLSHIEGPTSPPPYVPRAGDVWERGFTRLMLKEKFLYPFLWDTHKSNRLPFGRWEYRMWIDGGLCNPSLLIRDGWKLVHREPEVKV